MSDSWIYDHTSATTADVDITLSVTPQKVLVEKSKKNQIIRIADDGTEERISKSTDTSFFITLVWKRISSSDSGTIFDLWNDGAKASGVLNSFKWVHPIDGHTYVVRFDGDVERELGRGVYGYGITSITLKVLGRINDA